jgi:hypothetical protein
MYTTQMRLFAFRYSLGIGTNLREVVDCSFSVRVLEDDASDILVELEVFEVNNVHFDAKWACPGLHTGDRLRVNFVGDDKPKKLYDFSTGYTPIGMFFRLALSHIHTTEYILCTSVSC